jgi:hypothetical protein
MLASPESAERYQSSSKILDAAMVYFRLETYDAVIEEETLPVPSAVISAPAQFQGELRVANRGLEWTEMVSEAKTATPTDLIYPCVSGNTNS